MSDIKDLLDRVRDAIPASSKEGLEALGGLSQEIQGIRKEQEDLARALRDLQAAYKESILKSSYPITEEGRRAEEESAEPPSPEDILAKYALPEHPREEL